jgi:hypothetical protein
LLATAPECSQNQLRSWTAGITKIKELTKCNRDLSRIRLLIIEARCYKTRMHHKGYLIEINRASASRLYLKPSSTTADNKTFRSPQNREETPMLCRSKINEISMK